MNPTTPTARPNWTIEAIEAQLQRPLLELVFAAAAVHRDHHDATVVQCSQLLSIKTGGCPEDCGYCSQSAHHDTLVSREPLLGVDAVVSQAKRAKANGADRFCMGAAWRQAQDNAEFERVLEMVSRVKQLGLETCATLGMLTPQQASRLKAAGLDYYNHNLDTGASYYARVTRTRRYGDRLATLQAARKAGLRLCCGGILGLGESGSQRAELLWTLSQLDPPPESIPVNTLVAVPGTPLADQPPVTWDELVRVIATARIVLPKSTLRLSAGRDALSEEAQALCFLAGANSIFLGDELLTTPNPEPESDARLLQKLGLNHDAAPPPARASSRDGDPAREQS